MSWWNALFDNNIKDPIEALGDAADKIFTSDEERLQAEAILKKMAMQPQILQIELSKINAAHRSIFVAGARPFILWICGIGLGFAFLINPIIQWSTGENGPDLPLESISELIVALLGLGALRTIEKAINKTR